MQLDITKNFNRFILGLLALALVDCGLLDNTKSKESESVHLQLGVRYLSMNKLDMAKENLLLVLKMNSSNIQAHNALAFLYEKLDQIDDAKDHYETALSLAPNDSGVKNNFGHFLCEHGEHDKGMSLLSEASSNPLNNKPWQALANAGLCQLTLGKTQQAEAYFKQALQVDGSCVPALSEMQKIAYQNGDFWAAKGYLQRYLGVAEHTPVTLWFAAQTERAFGNKALANEYKKLLVERFPLSTEAKKINGVKDF